MAYLKLVFEKRKRSDQETPQVFFDHLQGAGQGPGAFLLESGKYGRYSYLGSDPFWTCKSENGTVRVLRHRDFAGYKKNGIEQIIEGQPFEVLRSLFKEFRFSGKPPVPFFGGAAGFFTYDFGTRLMNISQKVFDDTELSDFVFYFVDKVIVFDHEKNDFYFLAVAETDLKGYEKIEQLKKDLARPLPPVPAGEIGPVKSNLTQSQYEKKIEQIKQLLRDGETYQVNFSQRFSAPCTTDSWKMYKRLAANNPSPFSCYFDFQDFQIVSASPELLLRKRGEKIETWPIKGTVSRGKNEAEDQLHTNELLASAKDKAELAMIVDLARNDLGKVCEFGTVQVTNHRAIEKYSHVIHTFSKVEGRLARGKDFFDAMAALFPGGSITGCPKKRTMEIIDRLEDFKRGIYTGSAGFVSFAGDSDFNILIRSMLKKDGKISFHAGGGIVIDSEAAKEYQETLDKAQALQEILM